MNHENIQHETFQQSDLSLKLHFYCINNFLRDQWSIIYLPFVDNRKLAGLVLFIHLILLIFSSISKLLR